jgi:hypothetical protein
VVDHEVELIRAACVRLLQEQPFRWWLDYSLWHRIRADHHLARIVVGRYGDAEGQGGGARTGSVHGISHILGHGYTPNLERDYLESNGLQIDGVPVSRNPNGTAIFHWRA